MARHLLLISFIALASYSPIICCAQPTVALWGTTARGSSFGDGSIFRCESDGTNDSCVHSFNSTQGDFPVSGLTRANNGLLYGITMQGGFLSYGIIYSLNPITGAYFVRYHFNMTNGAWPSNELLLAPNGNLYGTARVGGAFSGGVLFEFNPYTGQYSVLHHFDFNAASPYCRLCYCSNGKIYGTTSFGTAFSYNVGAIFTYELNANAFTIIHEFDTLHGAYPEGGLIEASNGHLYGMTKRGGTFNEGVLYSLDTATNNVTVLFDFDSLNGRRPVGDVTEVASDVLYGITAQGGPSDYGIVFKWQISTGIFTRLVELNATSGAYPQGSFMYASTGQLYATTSGAGLLGNGTIIRIDPVDDSCFVVLNFDSIIGFQAMSDLLEMPLDVSVSHENMQACHFSVHPNPSDAKFICQWDNIEEGIPYSVYDQSGQEIQSGILELQYPVIDLSEQPAGIFLITCFISGQSFSAKLIKM